MLSFLRFFRREPAQPLVSDLVSDLAPEPLRVLHTPYSIAGNAFVMSELERSFGIESELVVFEDTSFGFKRHRSLDMSGYSARKREKMARRFLKESLNRYHIFHFNFGTSLIHRSPDLVYEDFELLKAHGKKIFITYQGCDIRDKDFSLANFGTNACAGCDFVDCNVERNRWKRQSALKAAQYADQIYVLNPDLLNACPTATFLPYASVDVNAITPPSLELNLHRPLRILHAPSSRLIKGTAYVLDALEKLKRDFDIEIVLVEGLPHQEALQKYREADIVIDQLLIGWYGAFAVECMALGKPVLAYLREDDLSKVSPEMRTNMGIYPTSRETLYQDLKALAQSAELRQEWSHRARNFAQEFHDPKKIVAQVVADYRRVMLS